MLQTILSIVIIIMVFVILALIHLLNKKVVQMENAQEKEHSKEMLSTVMGLLKMTKDELCSTRNELRGGMDKSREAMESRILETNKTINERLDNAAKAIMEVNTELGKVKEIGRNMKELQDFLRSPKLRGNIGEQVLADLLEQTFPRDHFELQYKFGSGHMVDAIIRTDKGLIPIDSKFPLDNFLRMVRSEGEAESKLYLHEFGKDIKKHIQDISRKYILPSEGTVDFAVMYVPSEAVYYEVIRHSVDLHQYAYEKKIFPVSPNSFYYFMKVILIGLQGKKIETAARRILETLDGIKKSNEKFSDLMGVLTTHVNNAKNATDRVNSEYSRLSSQIENVKLLK